MLIECTGLAISFPIYHGGVRAEKYKMKLIHHQNVSEAGLGWIGMTEEGDGHNKFPKVIC